MERDYIIDRLGMGPFYAKMHVVKMKVAIKFCEMRLEEIPDSNRKWIKASNTFREYPFEAACERLNIEEEIVFFWKVLLKGLTNNPKKLYKNFPESKHEFSIENLKLLAYQEHYHYYDVSYHDVRDHLPDYETSIMGAIKEGEDV